MRIYEETQCYNIMNIVFFGRSDHRERSCIYAVGGRGVYFFSNLNQGHCCNMASHYF